MDANTVYNLVGLAGGIILAVFYVPQIYRIIKRKSSEDISIYFVLGMVLGISFLEVMAVNDAFNNGVARTFFITNTLALVMVSTMFVLVIAYRPAVRAALKNLVERRER